MCVLSDGHWLARAVDPTPHRRDDPMFARLFARAHTSTAVATRKPAAHRFGLKLEALEGREVPATLTWIGTAATAAAFNDPASWISSDPQNNPTPQQGDDLIFRAPSAGGPVARW